MRVPSCNAVCPELISRACSSQRKSPLIHLFRMRIFTLVVFFVALSIIGAAQTPPVITSITSARQVVPLGGTLNLNVAATGATSYQWRCNGVPIAGAENSNLTVTVAEPLNSCTWYDVEIAAAKGTSRISILSRAIFVIPKASPTSGAIAAWGSMLIYPNQVPAASQVPNELGGIMAVAAGDYHGLAIRDNGTVVGWGYNEYRQATAPSGLTGVVAIAAGNAHSIALKEDGTVAMWGLDYDGKSILPPGLTSVVAIATGSSHNLALKQDGTVVAWGRNDRGESSVPANLSGVAAIAATESYSVALKQDGTVVTWGNVFEGQQQVIADLSNITSIAVGSGFGLALRQDGTLVTWGTLWHGSQPSNRDSASKVFPTTLTGITSITACRMNAGAVKQDGGVLLWGYNYYGQTTPPAALRGVRSLSFGSGFTLARFDSTGHTGPTVTNSPTRVSVYVGESATFSTAGSPDFPSLTYQWRKEGISIPGATNATLSLSNLRLSDAGSYDVVIRNYIGSATSRSAALAVNPIPAPFPPSFATQPSDVVSEVGRSVSLEMSVLGYPFPSIQWSKDGAPIVGATSSLFAIPQVSKATSGTYTATASSTIAGVRYAVTSTPATVIVIPSNALANLSVRTTLELEQTLTLGAVLSGGSKTILIRAGGPALNQFGLSGMIDPRLELFTTSTISPLATNDNWQTSLAPTFQSVGAFPFAIDSRDAAISQLLNGSFTVQAKGTGAGTVLVEAYDVTGGTSARMINISARNRVGTGSDILIAGFVVNGTGTKQVLIRAIGPTLINFGVTGTLADPQLEVFDNSRRSIASNDNWSSNLSTTFTQVGAFPLPAGSRDAAILTTLNAGTAYTVQVTGINNGTGEALVEIYEVF